MNVKSLLLGSAAAVAAASGAQAADPVVVIEPVTPNYVEVCDTFGAGYFYIPGTETCLDIGGYVRFQVSALSKQQPAWAADTPSTWDVFTKAQLEISSMTETELGVLSGVIKLNAEAHSSGFDAGDATFSIDQTYLALGGFQAGYFQSYWDEGLVGEIDDLSGNTKFNSMRYVFTGDGFVAGLSVDALTAKQVGTYVKESDDPNALNLAKIGISGRVGFQAGGLGFKVDGGYDTHNEDGSIRAMSSLALGPGSLDVGASWASGWNAYANTFDNWFDSYPFANAPAANSVYAEWQVAAGYALDVTDKFTITPAVQWTSVNIPTASNKSFYTFGALFDYEIVDGLSAKINLDYADLPDSYFNSDTWGGWFRLQRDF
ncbi:porin [uncultured Martelella sp.]|uniref:porin n=1 Tax=uncultured Martelella sp. TaxID=392331 RepID=UPI0029C79AB8|nr:porin [uncultured Martelella sp.]